MILGQIWVGEVIPCLPGKGTSPSGHGTGMRVIINGSRVTGEGKQRHFCTLDSGDAISPLLLPAVLYLPREFATASTISLHSAPFLHVCNKRLYPPDDLNYCIYKQTARTEHKRPD